MFDGVCVLCSGFARFILKRDRDFAFRFTTAQSPLGQALFRHYGLDTETFETNLVLVDGRAYAKLDTVWSPARGSAAAGGCCRCCACSRAPSPIGSMIASRATAIACSAAPKPA